MIGSGALFNTSKEINTDFDLIGKTIIESIQKYEKNII